MLGDPGLNAFAHGGTGKLRGIWAAEGRNQTMPCQLATAPWITRDCALDRSGLCPVSLATTPWIAGDCALYPSAAARDLYARILKLSMK